MIDASTGGFESGFDRGGQTREHAQLLKALGISELIVVLNKMDTVDWNEERYATIKKRLTDFLKRLGFKTKV